MKTPSKRSRRNPALDSSGVALEKALRLSVLVISAVRRCRVWRPAVVLALLVARLVVVLPAADWRVAVSLTHPLWERLDRLQGTRCRRWPVVVLRQEVRLLAVALRLVVERLRPGAVCGKTYSFKRAPRSQVRQSNHGRPVQLRAHKRQHLRLR